MLNYVLKKCFSEKIKKQEKIDKKQEIRRLGQKQGDLLSKAGEWPLMSHGYEIVEVKLE